MPTTPEPVVPPTVQADTLNWMREQITRLNDLTVDGAEYEQVPGGRQLRIPKPPVGFWARVRKSARVGYGYGSDDCQPYDWWEQEPIGCGDFQDDEFGRTGTLEDGDPAYSIPSDAVVPDDSIVWLRKGLAAITPDDELACSGSGAGDVTEPVIQEWYFQVGSGSGSGAGEDFITIQDTGFEGMSDDDNVYYDGRLNIYDKPEFVDDETTEKVWYIARNRAALATEEVVPGHDLGTTFDPHADNPSRASDPRRLFGGVPVAADVDLIVTSGTPVLFGSRYFFRCQREFYKPSVIAYNTRPLEFWWTDRFNNPEAARSGDKVSGTIVGYDDVDGSGVRKPIYKGLVTSISSDFLICFENRVLTRGGWFVLQSGRLIFVEKSDGVCVEATDLETPCASS